ncbi:ABC transporter [Salinarchaeum sp. Harcht-Bsk1]|uniref:ABC transporter permease n=1 Tax=Salinarchaeum sp. Harcht-Bsk1 TaxID=1333523 RepID=UPI00034234E2|nr:ABC transporter permease [Salinarchaeum sp. Harcht-Bsk1]AGN02928.1 ABC transporter [Salinarchaeum sp. Harcht-Bsk1]
MRRVGAIVVALGKNWLRSREAVFFSLVFPIVLLLIFSSVFAGGGSAEFTVYLQNNDVEDGTATNLSAAFVESLEESDALRVRTIDADRDLDEWSESSDADGPSRVLVIHDGFAERVRASAGRAQADVTMATLERLGPGLPDGTQQSVTEALRNGSTAGAGTPPANLTLLTAPDDNTAAAIRGIVGSYVAAFNERAVGVEQSPTTIRSGEIGDESLGAVDYFLPALIAAVMLINGVITLTGSVARYNTDGTLKRLASTPLRRWEWIVGHLLLQALLAIVITALMVGVAHLVFDVTVIPGVASMALILLAAMAFSAIGLTLGGLVSDQDAATSLGNAIAFPVLFLSGVFWDVELMPEYLQQVAELLPLYHLHRALRQLMVVGATEGVPLAVGSLGLLTVVFLGAAIRITRWRDFR